MRKYTPLIAGPLLVAAALTAQAVEADASPGPSVRVTVITHNIAGGEIHEGRPEALRVVDRRIVSERPDIVTLQEVCISQVQEFQRRHPGWKVFWSETRYSHPKCDGDPDPATTDPDSCNATKDCAPNGDEMGDIIATPHRAGNSRGVNLPRPRLGRQQTLLCADVRVRRQPVRACTTHIAPPGVERLEPGIRAEQIAKVSRLTRRWRSDLPVVVTGDFNVRPQESQLNPMWRHFTEVNQRPNHGSFKGRPRIDYIWWGGHRTGRVDGNFSRQVVSDHPIVWGTTKVKKR